MLRTVDLAGVALRALFDWLVDSDFGIQKSKTAAMKELKTWKARQQHVIAVAEVTCQAGGTTAESEEE
jgi:hypothetical protein